MKRRLSNFFRNKWLGWLLMVLGLSMQAAMWISGFTFINALTLLALLLVLAGAVVQVWLWELRVKS